MNNNSVVHIYLLFSKLYDGTMEHIVAHIGYSGCDVESLVEAPYLSK